MADAVRVEIEGLSDLREIGSGGFATVYVGSDDGFGRYVAVKVLHGLDEAGRRRFARECELMGRLDDHPSVVTPYRFGYTATGAPYVVMEYARHGSLQDLLDSGRRLEWSSAVDYLAPIGSALGHAHARGIQHRDVKPANILVTSTGMTKLTDFGISSIREATATSSVAFTLAHAPPETFADGFDRRDERSDLYSLASTLYTLVAGRPPFQVDGHDSHPAYMQRILSTPVPSLGRGPAIDRFLAAAMAKDPAARPPNADRFLEAMRISVAGSPQPGTVVTDDPLPPPEGRSWRGLALGLGGVAAVAIIALGAFALANLTQPADGEATTTTTVDESDRASGGGEGATAVEGAGTAAADPVQDQAVADRVVLQASDFGQGWTALQSRARDESVAAYEAVPECERAVPVVRGDGETAIAGRDVSFVAGNTAVSAIVAFYEDEGVAIERGPGLLLDVDYQRCLRSLIQASIEETNGPLDDFEISSAEMLAPTYGQRTEAVRHAATFVTPGLGERPFFTDELSVQIGRAVLTMVWASDADTDPFELELLQILGRRFEREMAAYN